MNVLFSELFLSPVDAPAIAIELFSSSFSAFLLVRYYLSLLPIKLFELSAISALYIYIYIGHPRIIHVLRGEFEMSRKFLMRANRLGKSMVGLSWGSSFLSRGRKLYSKLESAFQIARAIHILPAAKSENYIENPSSGFAVQVWD